MLNSMGQFLLSVDVESWVYSNTPELRALNSAGRRQADAGYVRDSMLEILDLFARHRSRTTFFMLGDTFDWYPDLVEDILKRGHEIGFHGHHHTALDTPEAIESALAEAKHFVTAVRPVGFRAPFMRLTPSGLAVLSAHGFAYDSSTYAPAAWPRRNAVMPELPVSTFGPVSGKRETVPLPGAFMTAVRRGEFPYGAAMVLPFLRSGIRPFIRRDLRRWGYAHVFLHNLQIVPVPNRVFHNPRLLLREPGCLQFVLRSRHVVDALLRDHPTMPLREFLGR